MKLIKLEVSTMFVNCYFYYCEETKDAVLIDPGGDYKLLNEFIDNNKLNLKAILLTHGHFDHIGAVENVRKHTNTSLIVHQDEVDLIKDPNKNLSKPFGAPIISINADKTVKDGDIIKVGNASLKVIHTKGHTPGGVCYYDKENKIIFVGDTLFRESIGRADFPLSDKDELLNSIKTKLLTLPEDVVCYCGHGAETTIGHEKVHNPYVLYS